MTGVVSERKYICSLSLSLSGYQVYLTRFLSLSLSHTHWTGWLCRPLDSPNTLTCHSAESKWSKSRVEKRDAMNALDTQLHERVMSRVKQEWDEILISPHNQLTKRSMSISRLCAQHTKWGVHWWSSNSATSTSSTAQFYRSPFSSAVKQCLHSFLLPFFPSISSFSFLLNTPWAGWSRMLHLATKEKETSYPVNIVPAEYPKSRE